MTSPASIEHCQRLADIACDIDAMKNHFSTAAETDLGAVVSALHHIAMTEAGSRANEIYAEAHDQNNH